MGNDSSGQPPRSPSDGPSSVGPTVDTFAERMRRKLREQAIQQGESHKASEQRHATMLQALSVLRRALQETAKIHLGPRFSLQTKVCDSEGWPKIELSLRDSLAPGQVDYCLTVTANDRSHGGWIDLSLRSGESLLRLSMAEDGALERLPHALKKTLRQFLDLIGNYVLNPIKPEELVSVQAQPLELSSLDQSLQDEEMFTEDFSSADNILSDEEAARQLAPLMVNLEK